MEELFRINPSDYKGMIRLMDKYGNEPLPFSGKNDKGESVIISVNPDNITIQTFQKNGWMRTNAYYRDGSTEELFER